MFPALHGKGAFLSRNVGYAEGLSGEGSFWLFLREGF
jgi:hypothetical protein